MTKGKRAMDLCLALLLLPILALPFVVIAAAILLRDGRPVFHRSERMKTPDTPFLMWKFRTMTATGPDSGVMGGHNAAQITRTGHALRRSRLDELPQLINILKGDMSFVGPRPPLPRYVALRPELYARVLRNRPGVTGLASLTYHAHETRLLAACESPEDTEQTYISRCIPAKARLDLIWARNHSLCFDLCLIWATLKYVFQRPGQRKSGN